MNNDEIITVDDIKDETEFEVTMKISEDNNIKAYQNMINKTIEEEWRFQVRDNFNFPRIMEDLKIGIKVNVDDFDSDHLQDYIMGDVLKGNDDFLPGQEKEFDEKYLTAKKEAAEVLSRRVQFIYNGIKELLRKAKELR